MKKKWYATDNAFKIYSLLIAIFLWVFVIYDQNPESTKIIRRVPVYYSNLDALESEGYTIYNEGEKFIDVKVKGKRLSLTKITKDNIAASVTFTDFKTGVQDLNIDIRLPQSDMSVADKTPSSMPVRIEKIVKKELDIGINYSGENQDGQIASGELSSETVVVSGPESMMANVDKARISLSYEEVQSVDSGTSAIHIYDTQGNDITGDINLKLSSDHVTWTRNIYNVKDVSIEMIFADNNAYTMEDLKISGKAVKICSEDSKNLDIDNVKTFPVSTDDVNKIKEGESVEVVLRLPSDVHVLKQDENGKWKINENGTVNISGKVLHLEKIPLTSQKLEITNKNNDMEYEIVSMPADISVKCKNDVTDELWSTVFKIDVSNLGEGEHNVKITADLPEGAQLFSDYTVKINIKKK